MMKTLVFQLMVLTIIDEVLERVEQVAVVKAGKTSILLCKQKSNTLLMVLR